MIKIKVFNNAPEELIEFKVNSWLEEKRDKVGDVDIISASQSQDGEYVTLTVFYKIQ